MIIDEQYNQLCKVTDTLREAIDDLYAAKASDSYSTLQQASRDFTAAESAWEAFALSLVAPK